MYQIKQNLKSIKDFLKKYPNVTLVAITKNRSPEEINEAIKCGIKIIGENRIQEAENKFPVIKPVLKHFVGHLQTNKAKEAVKLFDCIQSVDSFKLAEKISKESKKINKIMPIFVQINIGEDSDKFGITPEETNKLLTQIKKLPNIKLEGLMNIGKLTSNPEEIRKNFEKMKKLFENLKNSHKELKYLSMGMSNDYKIAAEEESNMVRIGSAIFK